MKILLIKLSSMGDLIQMLPGLTDAALAVPGVQFDWVVEESFKEIPLLHPNVHQIITIPYRRWKKEGINWSEVRSIWKQLRSQRYDKIIDAQSNIKSAFVTSLTKGKKFGLDKTSVREFGAHLAYHHKTSINRKQNHAERMRQLMSSMLGYPLPKYIADYGIKQDNLPVLDFELPINFIFINHLCSNKYRLWPEPYWAEVIADLVASGYDIVLPWWSVEEKERMLRLKGDNPRIHTIPPLNLPQKASVLAKARAAISVDTGLAHMAASLNVPNVCLYGPTAAQFTGTVGHKQIHITASGPDCMPCLRTTCHYQGPSQFKVPCMETIKPRQVLQAFYELMP